MPLFYSTDIEPCVKLALWKIEETESALFQGIRLSTQDRQAILSLRLEKRRLERIACRKALSSLLNTNDMDIAYGAYGEPLCSAGHLSFSHSGNYAAAAFSPTDPVGVDIEKITPKILGLHAKFVSIREQKYVDLQDPKAITRIWCAKEAIYKLFPEKSLDFLEEIEVMPAAGRAIVRFPTRNRHAISILLFFRETEDLMIVVAKAE